MHLGLVKVCLEVANVLLGLVIAHPWLLGCILGLT